MNVKSRKAKTQELIIDNSVRNVLSEKEKDRRIKVLQESMKASTWKDLETGRKFSKNDKLTFINDDMLILGCDIGSETHYVRAIDTRGRELSKEAFFL